MRRRYTITDVVSALAIFLMPWQARWIYGYHLFNGQRSEYGALSIYASSLVLLAALVLVLRQRSWKVRLGAPAWLFVGWLVFVVGTQLDTLIGIHTLSIMLLGFGYYIVASQIDRAYVLRVFVVSGVVQTVIAWHQFVVQHIGASTILGLAEHAPATLGQSVVIMDGSRILRAYGLLPHPNILGGFLVVAFAYAVYLYLEQTKERNARYLWKKWILQLSALLFIFSGIIITFSRAAIISAGVLLVGWTLYAYLIREKWFFLSLVRSIGYILVLCIALNGATGGVLLQRFGMAFMYSPEQERLEKISTDERITSYRQSAALAKPSHLIKGVGLGGFVPSIVREFPGFEIYEYQPAHNAFILMVLEIGVIGAVLYLWFVSHLLRDSWRERKKNVYWQYLVSIIFLVAFMGFFDHFLWTQFFGQSLWWLVVGTVVAQERLPVK